MINMKKDYGRKILSYKLLNFFNATLFEWNDCNVFDKNGYLKKSKLKKNIQNQKKKQKNNYLYIFYKIPTLILIIY